ncbi:MAG: phosphoglycerate transporter [Dehalococcoidia bacterium]|nr:phosphoglycerate transporter [Dehalococcoidia bacterium]
MTLRIGWFTTARGPGSRAMYEAVANAVFAGALDAEFAFVFCNREPGEDALTDSFFRLVQANGHPLLTKSSVGYRRAVGGALSRSGEPLPPWRIEYDRAVEELLASRPFDVGVLAGYMLIFEREFVSKHVILNLHPALPTGPAGTWREVIRHLIRTRASESGAMLHLAVPEVDAGPVVAHCRYTLRDAILDPLWSTLGDPSSLDDAAIEATPLFAAIRERGVVREAPLLVAALSEFASGRLRAQGGRADDASGADAVPADVTAAVEAALAPRR